MPRTEPLPVNEMERVENSIKREIVGAGSNVSDTSRRLNEVYETTESPASLARQIRQGTIPHWKVLRIADVLGYEIVWRKKDNEI